MHNCFSFSSSCLTQPLKRDVLVNIVLNDAVGRPRAIVDAITVEHQDQSQGERTTASFTSNDAGVQVFFSPDIFARPTYVVLPRRYDDGNTVNFSRLYMDPVCSPFCSLSSFSVLCSVSLPTPAFVASVCGSPPRVSITWSGGQLTSSPTFIRRPLQPRPVLPLSSPISD